MGIMELYWIILSSILVEPIYYLVSVIVGGLLIGFILTSSIYYYKQDISITTNGNCPSWKGKDEKNRQEIITYNDDNSTTILENSTLYTSIDSTDNIDNFNSFNSIDYTVQLQSNLSNNNFESFDKWFPKEQTMVDIKNLNSTQNIVLEENQELGNILAKSKFNRKKTGLLHEPMHELNVSNKVQIPKFEVINQISETFVLNMSTDKNHFSTPINNNNRHQIPNRIQYYHQNPSQPSYQSSNYTLHRNNNQLVGMGRYEEFDSNSYSKQSPNCTFSSHLSESLSSNPFEKGDNQDFVVQSYELSDKIKLLLNNQISPIKFFNYNDELPFDCKLFDLQDYQHEIHDLKEETIYKFRYCISNKYQGDEGKFAQYIRSIESNLTSFITKLGKNYSDNLFKLIRDIFCYTKDVPLNLEDVIDLFQIVQHQIELESSLAQIDMLRNNLIIIISLFELESFNSFYQTEFLKFPYYSSLNQATIIKIFKYYISFNNERLLSNLDLTIILIEQFSIFLYNNLSDASALKPIKIKYSEEVINEIIENYLVLCEVLNKVKLPQEVFLNILQKLNQTYEFINPFTVKYLVPPKININNVA